MMRRWMILLLLAAVPAHAGTLVTTITTGSDVCPVVVAPAVAACLKISDADIKRILVANKTFMGRGPLTETMILQRMTMQMIQQAVNRTQGYERGKISVAPISVK